MKSAICGCTCAIIIVCTFLFVAGISTNSTAKQRAVNTANECAYSALVSLYDFPDGYNSNDELIQAFRDGAETYMQSQKQDCTIRVYGADYQKGMIDVEVTCRYNDVFMNPQEATVRKAVIIDKERL